MKKSPVLLILSGLFVLTACPHKDPTIINLEPFEEKYRKSVPFHDGDTFVLQHETNKTLIEFKVWRYFQIDNEYEGETYYRYDPCIYYENYQQDITECRTDYPLFDFKLQMNNEYRISASNDSIDDNPYAKILSISAGNNFYTWLPFKGVTIGDYQVLDSMQVNGRTYHDVFELKNQSYDYEYEGANDGIQLLYYNYEDGIVGVEMSNGEKFMRYEE